MCGFIAEGTGGAQIIAVRGMQFCRVEMPATGFLSGWRRHRQWEKLRKKGIRQAVMPAAFVDEAVRWGIEAIPVYPLRRGTWTQLALSGDTAAIRAEREEDAVEEAAAALAERFRHLQLDIPGGAHRTSRMLYHCYGLCVGGGGRPTLTLSFGGAPAAEGEICLGEDCARWQAAEYDAIELPEGIESSEMLLSALYQAGRLQKGEIQLKSIRRQA